ncbi:MAG TPA: universal stress protein [Sedimenticola thiotaurini]|uniref:Universal stress protein n=1 Tax=Sedimenticola thiotaurini TaxID=1543721 RepID=A0A831RNH8_9GAMM|nr:universal stress protein [Sedimenticola thiotaurini]
MFKKILMPIDLQETHLAVKAVKIAIDEARKHGAEVYVMTVMPGFGMPMVASFFPDNAMKKALKEIGAELKRYIAANFPKDVTVHPVITEGSPAERILAQAKTIGADLIIIPSHAQSLGQVFLGSCAAKVVEHATCSVMVIKG